jgi:hypothetical protein
VASLPNSGNLYFRCNVLLGRFPKIPVGLAVPAYKNSPPVRRWWDRARSVHASLNRINIEPPHTRKNRF